MPESTEIIILAQGIHRRLGAHHGPRQLLPLPACGVPILYRTIRQCFHLMKHALWPTVVTWPDLAEVSRSWNIQCCNGVVSAAHHTLPDPGNSALKGIARYLELREQQGRRYQRTLVLLGDVVYSWACLEAIWLRGENNWGFVGTSNLSLDKGELWGVAWSKLYEDWMLTSLRDALLRHPPFDDEHEPHQLRRWISGMQRGDLADHVVKLKWAAHYTDIDDYTHDMDIPHDLVLLPDLSTAAAADDAKHGVLWTPAT